MFHADMNDAFSRAIEIDECSTSEPQLWIGFVGQSRILLTPDGVDELIGHLQRWRPEIIAEND